MNLLVTRLSGYYALQQLGSVAEPAAVAPFALVTVFPKVGSADRRSRSSAVFVLRGRNQQPSLWLCVLR